MIELLSRLYRTPCVLDTRFVKCTVVPVVVLLLATRASTSVRAGSLVGRAAVVCWAAAGLLLAVESSTYIASSDTAGAGVDLLVSATARALCGGRGGRFHGAVGQALAPVATVPLSILKVGSTRAVAVGLTRSGLLRSGTLAALGAVVPDVPLVAGDALAALVLAGALVTVGALLFSLLVPASVHAVEADLLCHYLATDPLADAAHLLLAVFAARAAVLGAAAVRAAAVSSLVLFGVLVAYVRESPRLTG